MAKEMLIEAKLPVFVTVKVEHDEDGVGTITEVIRAELFDVGIHDVNEALGASDDFGQLDIEHNGL